ncbi:aminotransferase class I/II-fold pyridoxal phosphate-dependent enzyme, partial [Escherichia coli]|uniref:aminotransferase class I/II-fold pyridoxal phosphate-dependent enzyme n=1 Tax=Escherichia coli TaxID=562 RepID=UPI0010F84665
LDIAYQGFGAGMEEDAYAMRAIASAGLPALVSNSVSKMFSIYGERVGGLSVMCEEAEAGGGVLGQWKETGGSNCARRQKLGGQGGAEVGEKRGKEGGGGG